jgi:Fungal specific transcription factor domain
MQLIPKANRGRLARGVLWPACVAGCLAERSNQDFFRDFVRAAVDDAVGFGNAQTALDILERFWAKSSQLGNPQSEAGKILKGLPQIIQQSGRRVLLV